MVSFSTEDADGSAHGHEAPPGLLDRFMQPRGVIAGVMGFLLFALMLVPIARQPWELDARSPVVESIDSECGPSTGAIFTIKVKGRSYRCGGSDDKCSWDGPVAVAYDPADPSRCRVAANVDRISNYESLIISASCGTALFMIAWVFYRRSEALRTADLLEGATTRQRRRARLRTLSAVLCIASMVVPLFSIVRWVLSTHS